MTIQDSATQTADVEDANISGVAGANDSLMNDLPNGVTNEPQDDEHATLSDIQVSIGDVGTYLAVSDDSGELLRNTDLEREVKDFCNRLDNMNYETIQDPQTMVNQIKELMDRYAPLINKAENCTTGIITKYRIRQGKLLLAQKKLVKFRLGRNWTQWFSDNYDRRMLRSAQDFMRIAEIPNSIRYAVFGKERLRNIIRQIGEPAGNDPISTFLGSHGIQFDPAAEADYDEFRILTDIAIERTKLDNNGLQAVNNEKLEAFIRGGHQIKKPIITQLKHTIEAGGDVNAYMDSLINSGGMIERIPTPQTKARKFKRSIQNFLQVTQNAIADQEYLTEVDYETYQQLKQMVLQLEEIFSQAAAK
jgi:hypothetical protein